MISKFITALSLASLLTACGPNREPQDGSSALSSITIGKYEGNQAWDVMRLKITDSATGRDAYSKDIKASEFNADGVAENATVKLPAGKDKKYKVSLKYMSMPTDAKKPSTQPRATEVLVYQNCDPEKEYLVNKASITMEVSICDKDGKEVGETPSEADVIVKPIGMGKSEEGQAQDATGQVLAKMKAVFESDAKFEFVRDSLRLAVISWKQYMEGKNKINLGEFALEMARIKEVLDQMKKDKKLTQNEITTLDSLYAELKKQGVLCDCY